MKASISLDEGVAPTLLQLLQCALCGSEVSKGPQPQGTAAGTSPGKQKKTKDKDKDKDKNEGKVLDPLSFLLICTLVKQNGYTGPWPFSDLYFDITLQI